jgi:DNA recombination protein Rad52
MFTDKQVAALSAPLDRTHVATRQQSGRALSYIEGWHTIAEANRIFGFHGWNRETLELRCVAERERKIGTAQKDGWSVSYIARVRVTVGSIIREGVGNGHGIDVDVGLAHESAAKEAETDAMKRALMTFGNPFGLALYDKSQSNVADPVSEDWAAFAVEFGEVLTRCETVQAVNQLWKARLERLNTMRDEAPPIYAATLDAAKTRKGALQPQQKAA